MAVDMTPKPGDYSINLPVTFDYKGGRSSNKKQQVLITLGTVLLVIVLEIIFFTNESMYLWQKLVLGVGVPVIALLFLRFIIFKELYFSDVYETLKADDYDLKLDYIWGIFDIDNEYPYICYFKNGYKGIFVRMEKDAITGKPEEAMYDHYQAIGDAYNVAHSLNMNITHIDYMDNVGNDPRMQQLYDDLALIENPDMQEMMIDIYANLQDEMSRNYSSFDIYLFLTKDRVNNFVYNVQRVCNTMLGGNFITYKVLDKFEISKVCVALFNLHDFSIVEACENVLARSTHSGIVPISLTHPDGTVEIFNKTQEELRIIREENERKAREAKEEAARQKKNRNNKNKDNTDMSNHNLVGGHDLVESVDLFGSSVLEDDSEEVAVTQSSNESNVTDDEDINLF